MCSSAGTHVAFLGPEGTYSHQVTNERFGDSAKLVTKDTIRDVYNALSPSVPYAVIPKDNSIFGPVTETYDLFRDEEMGRQKFIREELTLPIKHSFLVRKGTKLKDIKRVLSHEQALGQCTNFLSENVPNAVTEKVHSTAAAAAAILEQENAAAICSKVCATIYPGLEVLYEGIQNENVNYTKFWVIARSQIDPLPGASRNKSIYGALLRARAPSPQANLTPLFDNIRPPIVHIDRRPSPTSSPFQDVYFLELQCKFSDYTDLPDNGHTASLQKTPQEWEGDVRETSERLSSTGWNCDVLGSW